MTELTQIEYNEKLANLAIEIVNEALMEALNENESEDINDLIQQAVDSSEYMIYTAYHAELLKLSSNSESGIEQGLIEATTDLDELTQQYAYYAMHADLQECVSEAADNKNSELQSEIDELDAELEELDDKIDNAEDEPLYNDWLNRKDEVEERSAELEDCLDSLTRIIEQL